MSELPDPRFMLNRITASEWVINDLRYSPNDPRHVETQEELQQKYLRLTSGTADSKT